MSFQDPPRIPIPRAPGGPTADEMKSAVRKAIDEKHPEWRRSDVQLEFEKLGWNLIFTPPYCPQYQPIELFWAHGKNYVADMVFPKRSLIEARNQLRDGWYGCVNSDGQRHRACDCSKLISHCLKEAQKALDADELLSGKLGININVSENDKLEAQIMDTSHEGGDDPDFNDSLFVEDDCDELLDEIEP